MNVLPREKQAQIIHALVEGCSIRSIERMYDVHLDTIMRLLVRTGDHCMSIMDDRITNIPAGLYQIDELWCFVGKKDKRLQPEERHNPEIGSQYIFVAMDRDTKLVPSYRVGKRIAELANGIAVDLRERVVGRPTIITDGFDPYLEAVELAFGANVNFAQLIKTVSESRKPVREGYAPAIIVRCEKRPITGNPRRRDISTSHIERQNLTVRMSMRRLTRLTNAFSKKLDNLKAAVALHFAHYNFCRIHQTLRITPAMAAGISDHIWEINELLPQMRTWKFRQLIDALIEHGFELVPGKKKAKIYKGMVGGKTRLVTVHYHRGSDDIKPGTLAAMIRQSGLPKKLFR